MLARDRSRLIDTLARLDTCPLGSGALAGTAFGVDRARLAQDLASPRRRATASTRSATATMLASSRSRAR